MSASATAQHYQYQAKLEERGEIRLINVSRKPGGLIQCSFIHAQLFRTSISNKSLCDDVDVEDKWRCDLPYSAISYNWGSDLREETVEVEGRPFPVTTNLFNLLHEICLKRPGDLFWADAICIDQGNHAEKSHQVQQMPHIYEAAEQVCIYLAGYHLSGANSALMQAQENFDRSTRGQYWPADSPMWESAWKGSRAGIELNALCTEVEQKTAMRMLYSHPWFSRAWIIQEVAKARTAVIYCSGHRVSSRVFALMPRLIPLELGAHRQAILDIMPGPSRQTSWWREDRSLLRLLHKFSGSQARFRHDKIYALLGICTDSAARAVLQPDYHKGEEEVARDAVALLYSIPRHVLDEVPLNIQYFFEAQDSAMFERKLTSEPFDLIIGTEDDEFNSGGEEDDKDDQKWGKKVWSSASDFVALGYITSCLPSSSFNHQEIGERDGDRLWNLARIFFGRARLLNWSLKFAYSVGARQAFATDAALPNTNELAAAAYSRCAWRIEAVKGPDKQVSSSETLGPGGMLLSTAATQLAQSRDVVRALSRKMGQGAYSILRIMLRNFELKSKDSGPSLLETMLRYSNAPATVLSLLREDDLVHAIPSSAILIHALWDNKQCGREILREILRDILDSTARQRHPEIQPRHPPAMVLGTVPFLDDPNKFCLSDYELINICTRFGHTDEVEYCLQSLPPSNDNRVLITAPNLQLLRKSKLTDPPISLAILRLSEVLNFSFSLSGLLALIKACNQDELGALVRAQTKTADICRFLILPSLMLRPGASTSDEQQVADLVAAIESELEANTTTSESPGTTAESTPSQSPREQNRDDDDEHSTLPNNLERFAALILTSGFRDNNSLDPADRTTGWSPLTRAAARGDVKAAERLISHGADITEADDYGFTPLTWAHWLSQQAMVDLLLENGALSSLAGGGTSSRAYNAVFGEFDTIPTSSSSGGSSAPAVDGPEVIIPSRYLEMFDSFISKVIQTRPWHSGLRAGASRKRSRAWEWAERHPRDEIPVGEL
ncbi:heterokaryon incompatibility protein-domain-containing protein [Microdochium trichocladiopsis]|uniref:Heterokaryon incompatibility protein-domain-containing protein n=1 Tax=Microdochium trichocladiopsis TaxID=1682393 RepID=A0A9P9BTM5_9PEZI|nr:heterokaryon incompatibility protein-domain-containing protein [Microdochium trichocladiopsis]KAH7030619.1 heterokaryon incompatibility protein-domain-containing protein [Microdochium trichocladiopsis]